MKMLLAALALVSLGATPIMAQAISEYTRYNLDADCNLIDRAPDNEGEWADFVCTGHAGYPFVLRSSDGRESVTYGFATESGMATFAPFNYAHETVEWRVRIDRNTERPVAAIQRWFIADQDGNWSRQLLVVSKVGQPDGGGACAMAYVANTEGANERARQLADQLVDGFDCGSTAPTIEDGVREIVGER
jgi:hypothetical protein